MARPETLGKTMRFTFTSTASDLQDAYDAFNEQRGGTGPVFRYLAIVIGLMWLLGVVLVFARGLRGTSLWVPFAWLFLGIGATWFLGLKPILERRKVGAKATPLQELEIEFTDTGAHINARGVGEFIRPWNEFAGVYVHRKGLLLHMTDGMKHWLPARVFPDRGQIGELSSLIERNCPHWTEQ